MCPSLRDLILSYCQALVDLTGLEGCSQLESLQMVSCTSLTDMSALAAGPRDQLQSIDLSLCESLSDLFALGNCRALQHANFAECQQIADISALAKLHSPGACEPVWVQKGFGYHCLEELLSTAALGSLHVRSDS
eukprot:gene1459-32836_t